jgi:hypothetical protein
LDAGGHGLSLVSSSKVATLLHYGHLVQPASRDQALDAARAFHAEHGRLPRWREWERATAVGQA